MITQRICIPPTLGVTKRLTQQYVGPFKIIQRIGRLAYNLDIPHDWRIHPVYTVAQLEPAAADRYQRPRPDHPGSTFAEGDTNAYKSFEIERLLNKKTIRHGRGVVIQYLVRWKENGPEWDRWYSLKDLENAQGLVQEYEAEARGMSGPRARR